MSQNPPLQPSEVVEPPFRSYLDFLKGTVNFANSANIRITEEQLETAAAQWLFYTPLRIPSSFSGEIKLTRDKIIAIGGIREGGKTALLENLTAFWPKVIAFYGALDDELLGYLQAFKYLRKWERCLILGPKEVSLTSSWDYKPYTDFDFTTMRTYDCVVMPQRIHHTWKSFALACEFVADKLLKRPNVDESGYWAVDIAEAANLLWARQSLKSAKLDQAKAYMLWLLRQLRHVGCTVIMDSQYLLALDKEVRNICDYIFLKNLGAFSLPDDADWIYGYATPPSLRNLQPNEFVASDKFGGVYCGWSKLPPWHKTPDEDIYHKVGITWTAGDPELAEAEIPEGAAEGEDIATHNEIIRAFTDPTQRETYGNMRGTARATGHDRETVKKHTEAHVRKECSCYAK